MKFCLETFKFFAFDGPCQPERSDRAGIGIRASARGRDVSSANAIGRPDRANGLDRSSVLTSIEIRTEGGGENKMGHIRNEPGINVGDDFIRNT